jgi:hypothetical protein
MNIFFIPTSDVLINTFLRGVLVILLSVFVFNTTWYKGYIFAVIHDAISLYLISNLV